MTGSLTDIDDRQSGLSKNARGSARREQLPAEVVQCLSEFDDSVFLEDAEKSTGGCHR